MSPKARIEYLLSISKRYQNSTKKQKQLILDEFCEICGYHRKYAIRILRKKTEPKAVQKKGHRGRKKQYTDPQLLSVLYELWILTNLPCSKRLKTIIPLWLPHYPIILPEDVYYTLLRISPATIDRLMAEARSKHEKHRFATTKPGSLLKKQIPIHSGLWDATQPGFIEVDSVAHCGTTTVGTFVYTINCVDIATQWTEQRAAWGNGEKGVLDAIKSIECHLPFQLKGFDCDNGSEFINWHLYHHFVDRKVPVQFTRSRAYHKNDNAHVEEKNWTHIRQYLGYERFDRHELVERLNELYMTEWNDFFNFFIPSVKLVQKKRIGSKIIKVYDSPKTPFQRMIEMDSIDPNQKEKLTLLFNQLNPFDLREKIFTKIKYIMKIVKQN